MHYLVYILIGIAVVVVLLLLFFLVWRPLRRMARGAKRFAAEEYKEPVDAHPVGNLGTVANVMNDMAGRLNTLEDDQHKFLSNISHDFRSPLTSIKGYAQAMEDGTIPADMQEKYLNVIISETERLEGLTENILTLNNYSESGTYLDFTSFDLNEMIRQAILTFEGRAKEKGLSFQLALTDSPLYVRADSGKIDQVLHNLIDNAVKFSYDNTEIRIETSVRNGKAFTSIKDYGIGISKESQNKIWERFYKTDLSRGRDKNGTGLGLAIVKEIISAHHENINVISTEGVGSEFVFSLTLDPAH